MGYISKPSYWSILIESNVHAVGHLGLTVVLMTTKFRNVKMCHSTCFPNV